jgi:hypothetical protein
VTNRWPDDGRRMRPDIAHLLSDAPAWLMATAFEVEAGRLSLDQARARLQRHGVRFDDAAPARSLGERRRTAAAAEPARSDTWLDSLAAWREPR